MSELPRVENLPLPEIELTTRAVVRQVVAGFDEECTGCNARITYLAPQVAAKKGVDSLVVVCNVYDVNVWAGIEFYHPTCYVDAGKPHGLMSGRAPGEEYNRSKPMVGRQGARLVNTVVDIDPIELDKTRRRSR